ncbi:hypothetical protein CMI47_20515 [Candidatus Pacearchaeota archaeon]|nr:hypothetical protein [Candidatus Pacearchaeota archaeon]
MTFEEANIIQRIYAVLTGDILRDKAQRKFWGVRLHEGDKVNVYPTCDPKASVWMGLEEFMPKPLASKTAITAIRDMSEMLSIEFRAEGRPMKAFISERAPGGVRVEVHGRPNRQGRETSCKLLLTLDEVRQELREMYDG